GVDHRLDGKEHPLPHHRPVLRTAVMQDRGRVVEHPADTMPAKIADNRIAVTFGKALDRIADRADMDTGLHDRDAAHHRLVADIAELLRLDRDTVPDKEHPAGVAVPPAEDDGNVDVDDVAVH